MQAVFVFSHRIKVDTEGNLYTGGSFSQSVWDRYLSAFDKLLIVMRKESHIYTVEEAEAKFNKIMSDRISVKFLPDLTKISPDIFQNIYKRKEYNQVLAAAICESDYVIIRAANSSAIKFAQLYKKPYLVEMVGCSWDALWNHSWKGKIIALPSYLRMKKAVKHAPYVIYVTQKFLQNRYPTNGQSVGISNVDLPDTDDAVLERRIERIRNHRGHIIIGTAAAVDVRYKGQQYVIQALSKLKKQGKGHFEYQIAGGGDPAYLQSIAAKYDVQEQVKIIGSLPHSKVFEWMDSIDVYIQPSLQEGLPRAMIEAMSRGCPCLGAQTGGIPELIDDMHIFKRASSHAVFRSIVDLLDSDIIECAKKNFEKSKTYYSQINNKRRIEFLSKTMLEALIDK